MAKTKWEKKMHEQRELRKRGAEVLYDRTVLLVACYDDEEFRSWCEAEGVNELDYLDDELADVAATFLTMRSVLAAYPERDSWAKHNVRDLMAESIAADKAATCDERSARMSWKERALKAEAECERLRGELSTMRDSLGIVAGAKCG